jgi:hypothetical protein
MNVSYEDGTNQIMPYTEEDFAREAARPDFVSALVYQPGKNVKIGNREYRVGKAGNLIRTDKER